MQRSPARRTKKEEGPTRGSPVTAPMPKSDSSWEKREDLGCIILAYGSAYLSPSGWPCIYNVYCSQFEGRKDSFLLEEILLAFIE